MPLLFNLLILSLFFFNTVHSLNPVKEKLGEELAKENPAPEKETSEILQNPPFPPAVVNAEDPLDFEDKLPRTPYVLMPGVDPRGEPLSLGDAVSYTLENQIAIQLAQLQIYVQKGILRSAAGPFDYYFQGSATYIDQHNLQIPGFIKSDKRGNETIASLSATTTARIGTEYTLSAQVDKVNNPLNIPTTDNIGSVTFLVQQPLLNGFLNGINWMQEKAAAYALWASYFDDFQTISQSIYNTTVAYWQAVANQKILAMQEQSLIQIVDLEVKIEELVKAHQLAVEDILQPQQQEVDQILNILSAQETLYASIEELKLTMGDVSITDFEDIPFDLTDDFPMPPLDTLAFQRQFRDYIHYASNYRFDIQASVLRQIQAYYVLKGAANNVLPTLNLVGGVNWQNFEAGEDGKPVLSPLEMHRPQTNWSIGVSLAFPLFDDGPIGIWEQEKAQYNQSVLSTQLLQEQAITALRTALSNQIVIMGQLKEAEESVRLSKLLYDNGVIQIQAGLVSLFDLLSFQSRLTNAYIQRISFQAQYMQNIALLRFLTSTTFEQQADSCCIKISNLNVFPEFRTDNPKPSPRMEKYLEKIKRIKEQNKK